MHTYIHPCILTHTYVHACIHTCIRTCKHDPYLSLPYVHAYIHTYIHPFIQITLLLHVHAHIHTYIHSSYTCMHTYIRIYIHAYISSLLLHITLTYKQHTPYMHIYQLTPTYHPCISTSIPAYLKKKASKIISKNTLKRSEILKHLNQHHKKKISKNNKKKINIKTSQPTYQPLWHWQGARNCNASPPPLFFFRDYRGTFQTLKMRGRRKRGSRRGAEIQTKPSNLNPT